MTRIWWARGLLRIAGVRMAVTGVEHIPLHSGTVLIANHPGSLDILALLACCPGKTVFVSKQENFFIPFIGWHMYLNGYIPIRRGQATSAVRCMNSVARAVKRGWRVIFFAEGTRSGDEFVHPFKTGVAYLVTEHHLPVLPVAIFGSHALLPRASLLFRPGTVRIAIGPELSFDGLDPADRRAHVRHMRTAVADLHGTIGGGGVVGPDVP